jgi:glycosyltransferase involved in cell wall biosynthesis
MSLASSRPQCVAFVGPVAKRGQSAIGGYEAANRRTINLLNRAGVSVVEFPYPVARGPKWLKSLIYLIGFVRIVIGIVTRNKAFQLIHITPLRRQFIPAELALCQLTKLLHKKLLLDIRGGDFINAYNRHGTAYQRCLKAMVAAADGIGCEGLSGVQFLINNLMARNVFYFPNYVATRPDRTSIEFEELSRCIYLLMLGRVVPEKGIGLGIECVKILNRSNTNARLEIIGTGPSDYIAQLEDQAKFAPVTFTGGLAPKQIQQRLIANHFFLFPTTHYGEGHSNALTEAMYAGLVPICSDHGFNKDVVGECGFLLPPTAGPDDYARVLKNAVRDPAMMKDLSRRAMDRVQRRFSDQSVIPVLLHEYSKMAQ